LTAQPGAVQETLSTKALCPEVGEHLNVPFAGGLGILTRMNPAQIT